MKIVIVNAHVDDRVGGSELQCDLLARGLSARGHEVHYVAVLGQKRQASRPYMIHSVALSGSNIGDKCLEIMPDVVYWRFNKRCFRRAARAIVKGGIPIVFSVSHVTDTEKWGTSRFSRRDPGVKGLARALKSSMLSRLNYHGFKLVSGVIVNNPEHLGLIDVRKQQYIANAMLADSMDFSWDRPFVAWIANIKPPKQPEVFVALAHELKSRGVDCVMVGRIQDPRYSWLLRREELPENFYYLGEKSPLEVSGMLAKAVLHIHTCVPEGFSNVFIQAWLQACPSVSLEFDPGGYITRHRLGGYAAGNWTTFVDQIGTYLSDAELRDAAGERAHNFSHKMFSVTRLIDEVEVFLDEVISRNGRIRWST